MTPAEELAYLELKIQRLEVIINAVNKYQETFDTLSRHAIFAKNLPSHWTGDIIRYYQFYATVQDMKRSRLDNEIRIKLAELRRKYQEVQGAANQLRIGL